MFYMIGFQVKDQMFVWVIEVVIVNQVVVIVVVLWQSVDEIKFICLFQEGEMGIEMLLLFVKEEVEEMFQ